MDIHWELNSQPWRGKSMTEVWLRSNKRVMMAGLLPGGLLAVGGGTLLLTTDSRALQWVAIALLLLAAICIGVVVRQCSRPRIAYSAGLVLFYLRAGRPIAVPVHVVEAFFLGQGPSYLPAIGTHRLQTVNLVARMSQKEPQWAQVEVKPALGKWSEGYLSIRGTWCEPLTEQLIRRLNRRLREVGNEVPAAARSS